MFQDLLASVRAETSGERALESVRDLARMHRVQASPGYDRAAEWLAARISSHGLEPRIERVPGDGRTRFLGQLMPEGWDCSRAVATVIEGEERERICDYEEARLSLVLRSAPARGRFRLVAIENGERPEDYDGMDVRGAVALVGAAGARRAYELAVLERGAAGLLCDGRRLVPPVRERFDDPDALAYTSFWWAGDEPRGWGFVVSPRAGARLRERLARGAALEIEVEIESRRFATEIPLVSTTIPGDREGEILIIAHLCHPQPSANDNASGAAAALECARVLATLRARGEWTPRRSVRFLWIPEITGTFAWLAREPDRAGAITAAINLDMVGQNQERCGSTMLIERPPCFASSFAEDLLARVRAEALDWVRSYSGPGHYSMTRIAEIPYSGGSDHAVLTDPGIGVPCPMIIQWPDRFYHSSHDTPDHTDPSSLALAVRCAATYAGFLAGAGSEEARWLMDLVERRARARLLGAPDDPDPDRVAERERMRGRNAIASLERLGADPDERARAVKRLDEFLAREIRATEPASVATDAGAGRPHRRVAAPLDYQRHLIAGYESLTREEREAWRRLDSTVADAALLFDLAWFLADGTRTVDQIARWVWIETGRHEPRAIAEFFATTERLGCSTGALAGEGAWSGGARGAVTP